MSAKKQKKIKKTDSHKRIKQKKSFLIKVRNFILTSIVGGIVVILPITISVVALRFLWIQIQRVTAPIKNIIDLSDNLAAWVVDLTAFGIMIFAFFLLGLFVQTNFGKELWNYIDNQFLSKLPLYNVLRDTVQQFLGNTDKMPFSEVVEVDVFNNGTRMIGFVSDQLSDGRYSIFVPTGPNPTNGFIFLVEKEQLQFSKVRPEEAMRIVVGVGTGAAELFSNKQSSPKAILEKS